MNSLAKIAYASLFDDADSYLFELKYSSRFSAFNANIRYYSKSRKYYLSLSREWKTVSKEITIGLIQSLILRLKKIKTRKTLNMDLYENFLKHVNDYAPKTKVDPFLKEIFDDLNSRFFNGFLHDCNLKWGSFSKRTLGHYSFGSDTITISTVFKNIPKDKLPLLELVLYHEMLHKKHKFKTDGINNRYHTPEFKKDEQLFPNYEHLSKELSTFVRYRRNLSEVKNNTVLRKKKLKQKWTFFKNPNSLQ